MELWKQILLIHMGLNKILEAITYNLNRIELCNTLAVYIPAPGDPD